MKIQKFLFILITIVVLSFITSCTIIDSNSLVNVKLYLIKDDVYFTHPLGYVEVEKEYGSQLEEADLDEFIKQVHGVDDDSYVVDIKNYKLYKDSNLEEEIDTNYILTNDLSIYVLATVDISSFKMGANNLPETAMYYTGSVVPEELKVDKNFFYPLNSLYVSGYYIPLDSNTVSFDLLYEVFVNYRRMEKLLGHGNGLSQYEEEFNVDLTCKEKFSFVVTSVEQLDNTDALDYVVLQENDTFTFDQQGYLIEVCYDGQNLGLLSWGHC